MKPYYDEGGIELTTILYVVHKATDEAGGIKRRRDLIELAEEAGFEVIGADTVNEPRIAALERIMSEGES